VSAEPGSITVLSRLIALPSGLDSGASVMAAVGATLATVTSTVSESSPPLIEMTT
jgi:hypothetical protein